MTSISGSTSAMMSPGDRMQLMLQKAVSAGTVKSTDQSALSGALGDIDAAMKSSGPPAAGTSREAMKTKVDGLVDQEVSDGKLTTDQATELKQVFAQAAQKMGGHHGPHGAGGPPPVTSDNDSDDSTTSTTASTSSGSVVDQLIAFLEKLKESTSSTTNYTAGGTSASSTTSSLLVNASA